MGLAGGASGKRPASPDMKMKSLKTGQVSHRGECVSFSLSLGASKRTIVLLIHFLLWRIIKISVGAGEDLCNDLI